MVQWTNFYRYFHLENKSGNWRKDCMEGYGVVYFAYGGSVKGEFKKNKLNGIGIFISVMGNIYMGEYVEGKPRNPFLYFKKDDSKWYEAEYHAHVLTFVKEQKVKSKLKMFKRNSIVSSLSSILSIY